MNHDLEAVLHANKLKHGDKWDSSDLAPKFVPFYHGQRIKVRFSVGGGGSETDLLNNVIEKTGIVSMTTGWRPSFMLILRATDCDSQWLLSQEDEIVAVQHGRTYVPVANLYRDPNKVTEKVEV